MELVGLAFHVDYWDGLGWRDRFSTAAHTDRQKRYQKALGGPEVYTPQAVVDGKWECVGGDPAALEERVTEAIAAPKLQVSVDLVADKERDVTARIAVKRAPFPAEEAEVWLALAEDGLDTEVARGENAGRRLSHTAVVRALERVGTFVGRPFAATHQVKPRREWRRDALKVVVLVQERASGRVLGLAARPL